MPALNENAQYILLDKNKILFANSGSGGAIKTLVTSN